MMRTRPSLNLGPLLFHWPETQIRDFYFRVADDAPFDVVYVGEVVCLKRWPLIASYLPQIIERLRSAGKTVVRSMPALVTSDQEQAHTRDIIRDTETLIEVNDVGALAQLAGRAHTVGPFVNVYNEEAARFMAANGAVRIAPPYDLARGHLARLAEAVPVELEVQVFGRLPLAISARCYHARVNSLSKDSCRYVCSRDPDGLPLRTLNEHGFLAINGVQTLSYAYVNLLREIPALLAMGVGHFRLSPHTADMVKIARVFRGLLDGRNDPAEAQCRLRRLLPPSALWCNGFYHGAAGASYMVE